MFYSPLRYPGGKNRLAKFIEQVCIDNSVGGHYVEPYAGGASVALHLLIGGQVEKVTINDLDRSIYAVWWSILRKTDELCERIEETEISIDTWKEMKKLQKGKSRKRLLDLGFSTLFLNRTNFSGIIDGGPIGGIDQSGKYKIDCRFNKETIIERIRKIAEYKDKINIQNQDALELIENVKKDSKNLDTIFYFDPPYFLKGPGLYMNSYKKDDHKEVADKISEIKNIHWIVSYDNQEEIKSIYKWLPEDKKHEFNLNYSAQKNKQGEEVMFFSPSLDKVDFSLLE